MFKIILLIIAKTRKQPRCLQVDEWINWVHLNSIIYSALKRKRAIKSWRDMDETSLLLLVKKMPIWKGYNYMIPTTWDTGKGKTTETIKGW